MQEEHRDCGTGCGQGWDTAVYLTAKDCRLGRAEGASEFGDSIASEPNARVVGRSVAKSLNAAVGMEWFAENGEGWVREAGSAQWLSKFSYFLVCLVAMGLTMPASTLARAAEHAREVRNSSKALRFEANRGQTDEQVKYLARATGYNIFLAENEADIVLHHEMRPSETVARGKMIVVRAYASVLRLRFANSNPPTKIVPLLYRRGGGNSVTAECTAVAYRGVYPGTDIIFRGNQQKVGLDLDLSPGADLNGMVLTLDGATGIILDVAGNAVVRMGEVSLVLERPAIFEVRGGRRRPLAGSYRIEPNNRLRFVVGVSGTNEQVITD